MSRIIKLNEEARQQVCTGKHPYRSRGDARRALKLHGAYSGPDRQVTYRCPFCSLFHNGHPPGSSQKKIHVSEMESKDVGTKETRWGDEFGTILLDVTQDTQTGRRSYGNARWMGGPILMIPPEFLEHLNPDICTRNGDELTIMQYRVRISGPVADGRIKTVKISEDGPVKKPGPRSRTL